MIKLIFSKGKDIMKTATFPEKNFSAAIYLGFCHCLSIIRTLRTLDISGPQCLGSTVFKTLEKKTQRKFLSLQKKNLSQGILPEEFGHLVELQTTHKFGVL